MTHSKKAARPIQVPPVVKSQILAMFGENAKLTYQNGFGYVVRLSPEKDYIRPIAWNDKRRPTEEDKIDLMVIHGILIGGVRDDWDHVKAWLKANQQVTKAVEVEQLGLPLAA